MKCVTKDHVKPTVLAPGKYAIDVEPIPPRNRNNREVHLDYLKHLKESVETLREIVEEAKVERPLDRSIVSACRYTKHSQELLEYAIGTCPKDFNQRDKKHAPTPLIRKKQVAFEAKYDTSNSITHKHVEQLHTQKTNVPVPPSTGVNSCTDASGSQPRSNTKKNRISPAKSVNKTKVEEHPRTNKSNVKTANRVDSSISSKRTVKFFRSKDETLEVVIKLLKQIQVGLNKIVRYIRTDNGTEFVNKDLTEYYEQAARTMLIFSKASMFLWAEAVATAYLTDYYERVGIFHQKTVPRTLQQNDVVERRNRTLVEAARTMLIFSKALMFLWAEAVATACYTQNRSPLFPIVTAKPI
ncbi:retrovirus-related pol polyprotein from transposon TNT 1-94 [Tanacetum coccineum]